MFLFVCFEARSCVYSPSRFYLKKTTIAANKKKKKCLWATLFPAVKA